MVPQYSELSLLGETNILVTDTLHQYWIAQQPDAESTLKFTFDVWKFMLVH